MVVGNGLVANKFYNYFEKSKEILIFASGVSNSKCTDTSEYDREIELIIDTITANPDAHFVYFSTCSIYNPSLAPTAYVEHKKKIEKLISQKLKSYHIFRVSNIVGTSKNKNTVLNYFFDKIKNNEQFDLWVNASRNFIDIEDLYKLVFEILKDNYKKNSIINVASPISHTVQSIVSTIEAHSGIKAKYIKKDKGATFAIEINEIYDYIVKLDIIFTDDYLLQLLNKYFK